MDILENPLPGPFSATNASSTSQHQHKKESIISNGVKSDSMDDFWKMHVENSSSNGSFLVDDHSLQPENPFHSESFGFFPVENTPFTTNDSDLLSIQDDKLLKEEKTGEALQDTIRNNPNVYAIERDYTDNNASQAVDSLGDTHFQNNDTLVSSPKKNEMSDKHHTNPQNDPFKTLVLYPRQNDISDKHHTNPQNDLFKTLVSSPRHNDISDHHMNPQNDPVKTLVSSPRKNEMSDKYHTDPQNDPFKTLVSAPRQNDISDHHTNPQNDPVKNSFLMSPSVSIASVGTQPSLDSPKTPGTIAKRIQIDTAAPIESVKHAVSRFGGILDWKAHRAHTMEKRQIIEQELERVHHEIPFYKKLCQDAEDSKKKILKELDTTKRLIEEMKIQLEKVQTEELQAKQDAELAKLRVEEMEQGIAGESSVAAKAQLEVAKARYVAAITELKALKDEFEALRKDYALLKTERDIAAIKAQEAVLNSRKVEKEVEDLTIELMTVKESLETAHASHLEADEQRITAVEGRKLDTLKWQEAVNQLEEELEGLNRKFRLKKDLKLKLDTTSASLKDLKAELATYMQSKDGNFDVDRTRAGIRAAIASAIKELAEVKMNAEKTIGEVDCLRMGASSLKIDIEQEKTKLGSIKQKERTSSIGISSLESEIKLMKSEIANVQSEVQSAREKMVELDNQLEQSAQDAEESAMVVEIINEKVLTAKEETEQEKARARNMESRLYIAQKEIEAAKNTEKLALAVISVMHECESARKGNDSPTGVNLSLEQYYDLSKQAHDAEEEANNMVTEAVSQIDVANESKSINLNKLEKLELEIAEEKAKLEDALEKSEKAKESKIAVEHELRQWREEHEQKRKAIDSDHPTSHMSISPTFGENKETESVDSDHDEEAMVAQKMSPKANLTESDTLIDPSHEVHPTKKKKKSFFPRFLLFFAKKKAHSKKT